MNRVLIIGGPGNISSSTIEDLLKRGDCVGIFTLPGSNTEGLESQVEFYFGDRNEPGKLENAVSGFKPDIVIDYSCFAPEQAKMLGDILIGSIDQFIFISTCDVYGYPLRYLPMREDDSFNEPNCEYAANKRKCEELLKSYGTDKLPLTIVRPSYSMGKNFAITPFSREGIKDMVCRLKSGKSIVVPGDGTTLIHPSAAYNTGRMIAQLVGKDFAIGESYTCGHDTFMSHDDYIKTFARVLGVEPNIIHMPTDLLYSLNIDEINNSLLNVLTRHNVAFSMGKFKKHFPDFKWELSIEDVVRQYIEWNEKLNTFTGAEEETFEDKLIRAWKQSAIIMKNLI